MATTTGDGGHLSSGSFSQTRRAERRERRERDRRRKGAAASDEAFGGDDVALAEAYAAARRDDVPELEDALQRGVMPRATDEGGNTLLHAACARGALRAAKLVVRWAVYSAHPPDRNFLNLQSAEDSPPSTSPGRAGSARWRNGSWRSVRWGEAGRARDPSRTTPRRPVEPARAVDTPVTGGPITGMLIKGMPILT
jgi:hypothetical protein